MRFWITFLIRVHSRAFAAKRVSNTNHAHDAVFVSRNAVRAEADC